MDAHGGTRMKTAAEHMKECEDWRYVLEKMAAHLEEWRKRSPIAKCHDIDGLLSVKPTNDGGLCMYADGDELHCLHPDSVLMLIEVLFGLFPEKCESAYERYQELGQGNCESRAAAFAAVTNARATSAVADSS
jgi:hypothetical protein